MVEARIAYFLDLAHSTRTDLSNHFVRTQTATWRPYRTVARRGAPSPAHFPICYFTAAIDMNGGQLWFVVALTNPRHRD